MIFRKNILLSIFIIVFVINSYPQDSTEITTPWEVIGNPYSQRNEHIRMGKNKFDYYGSGDVNNDGEINNSDLGSIVGSGSYRADVNLDGVSGTSQDRETLEDYLFGNGEIISNWNNFSKEEKISFLDKFRSLYDFSPYLNLPEWGCRHWINQACFDAGGLLNSEEFDGEVDYNFEENGLFNLPSYYVSTKNVNFDNHSVLGFLVGENPLDFEDWYFMNYQGERTFPGNPHMHEDGYAYVNLLAYKQAGPFDPNHGVVTGIVKWDLDGGEPTLRDDYRKDLLITSNPNRMEPRLNSLGDLYVQGEEGQSLDPFVLEQLGYNAVPDTFLTNVPSREEGSEWTKPKVEFTYRDRDTIPLSTTNPELHFKFTRRWYLSAYLGGILKRDSTEHQITADLITGISQTNTPTDLKLYQNYPNPFNPSTTIEYSIPTVGSAYNAFRNVRIDVFSSLGKHIITLLNEHKPPGNYSVTFDASDLPSGVYYYKINSGNFTEAMKMLLVK